jgi:DUF971 family protein
MQLTVFFVVIRRVKMKPQKIQHLAEQHGLKLIYSDQESVLSAEYLRVFSPSAEIQGHGNEPMKILAGKRLIAIKGLEASGHYALKISFDDGHDSGIYTWSYLRQLVEKEQENWTFYTNQLAQKGLSREPNGLGDIMIKNLTDS